MSKKNEIYHPTIIFKIESFIPFTNKELKDLAEVDGYDNVNKTDDYIVEVTKILHRDYEEDAAYDAVERHKQVLETYLSAFARAKRVLEIGKCKLFLT